MNDRENTAVKAADLFNDGFHCSQAVLCACSKLFREEPPPPELTAAMAPFAAGMASSGQACGALSGALAAVGFALGKTAPKGENHKAMGQIGHKMVSEFTRITAEHGGINCADIAKVDWQDAEAVRQFRTDPDSRRKHCVRVVQETAAILHDLAKKHLA
jgi:C_GCAxxG_C_C family probable redox protein